MRDRRAKLNEANYPSEVWFMGMLNAHGLTGYERNYPLLTRFFGDFVFIGRKLIVEIDGQSHAGKEDYDKLRDDTLRAHGWRVLRIRAYDRVDGELTLKLIREILESSIGFKGDIKKDRKHRIQLKGRRNKFLRRQMRGEAKKAARIAAASGVSRQWMQTRGVETIKASYNYDRPKRPKPIPQKKFIPRAILIKKATSGCTN